MTFLLQFHIITFISAYITRVSSKVHFLSVIVLVSDNVDVITYLCLNLQLYEYLKKLSKNKTKHFQCALKMQIYRTTQKYSTDMLQL